MTLALAGRAARGCRRCLNGVTVRPRSWPIDMVPSRNSFGCATRERAVSGHGSKKLRGTPESAFSLPTGYPSETRADA